MELWFLFLLIFISMVTGITIISREYSDRFGYLMILGTICNIIVVIVSYVYDILSGISGG